MLQCEFGDHGAARSAPVGHAGTIGKGVDYRIAERLFSSGYGRRSQVGMANNARFSSFLAQLRLERGPERSELALSDPETDERVEMEVTATEVRDPHGAVVAIVAAMATRASVCLTGDSVRGGRAGSAAAP